MHAFANDPERGVFILAILAAFIGGALTLYALRAATMEAKGVFSLVSRESALVANNILLAVACFVVFIGTVWPLVAELLFQRKLSVGPPFFDMAFTPFMIVIAVVLPVGAILPWKRARLARAALPLRGRFLLSFAVLRADLDRPDWPVRPRAHRRRSLATWVIAGTAIDLVQRLGEGI